MQILFIPLGGFSNLLTYVIFEDICSQALSANSVVHLTCISGWNSLYCFYPLDFCCEQFKSSFGIRFVLRCSLGNMILLGVIATTPNNKSNQSQAVVIILILPQILSPHEFFFSLLNQAYSDMSFATLRSPPRTAYT